MLDRLSSVPLYIQLKEIIKDKILKGQLKEGDKIPGELDLMQQYGVSRATVRAAIEEMIKEGLLVRKHGYGTFVRKLRPSLGFEPLISLSYALESLGIVSKNTVLERGFVIVQKELLKQAKWKSKSFSKIYHVKRLRFVDDIPIALEISYFAPDIGKLIERKNLEGSIAKILVEDLCIKVKRVEQIVFPRSASMEEKNLMHLPEDTELIEMQRWIYADGFDHVIYYLNLFMRDDLTKLRG